MDPALWHLGHVNRLELCLPAGVLSSIPGDLGFMTSMLTLILSNNSLTSLPEEIGNLVLLKNFEAANNQLVALPQSMGKLENLELLNLADNKLEDITALKPLTNLVTVSLDRNALTSLEGLNFPNLQRLRTLNACDNQLATLDATVGQLGLLENLNLERNKLTEVPCELGNLLKKMQTLKMDDNPIKDPKVKKNLKKAVEGGRDLKEVLKFLVKNGAQSGGGGGGKKGKKKK